MNNQKTSRLTKLVAGICCLASFSLPMAARAADTGAMLRTCQTEQLEFASTCLGFMAGIDETHNSMRSLLLSISAQDDLVSIEPDWQGLYCPPMQLTPEQLRDVFVSFAVSNPESHPWPAALTMMLALGDTLPCGN